MRELTNSRLLRLLAESSKEEMCVTILKTAYEEFAVKLLEKLQMEPNLVKLYYNLGFVKLELAELTQEFSSETKKKCSRIY